MFMRNSPIRKQAGSNKLSNLIVTTIIIYTIIFGTLALSEIVSVFVDIRICKGIRIWR
jgi:hypothetical protein